MGSTVQYEPDRYLDTAYFPAKYGGGIQFNKASALANAELHVADFNAAFTNFITATSGETDDFSYVKYPILYHPANANPAGDIGFNASDPIGDLYQTLFADSFSALSGFGGYSVPSQVDYDNRSIPAATQTANLMYQAIANTGIALAGYYTASIDTIITTLMAPFIVQSNAQRDLEIAKMNQTAFTANGFFNSATLDRVNEITNRWAIVLNERLAQFNFEFRKLYADISLRAISTLGSTPNLPLIDFIQTQNSRGELTFTKGSQTVQAYGQVTNILNGGVAYGTDQSKRYYANSQGIWHGYMDMHKWQADYYQQLNNVTGGGHVLPSGWQIAANAIAGLSQGVVGIMGAVNKGNTSPTIPGGSVGDSWTGDAIGPATTGGAINQASNAFG